MNKATKRQTIRRTEKGKLDLIESWEESGLSIKRFCEEHRFSDSLFHTWLNKYRRNKDGKPASKFVPVHITHPVTSSDDRCSPYAEVILNGGSRIKLYHLV